MKTLGASRLSRRAFLSTAACGISSFAVGCAAFSSPRARRIASGARLRVALIGCGGRMMQMLAGIVKEHVVALCDPDAVSLDTTLLKMRELGVSETELSEMRLWRDYRKMFAEYADAVDAVVIATPNHHHCLPAVMAMRRGIHVYVEKPMALTVAEARLMTNVARRTGVVTQVGNQGQSTVNARLWADLVAEGAIGAIRDVWAFDDRLNAMMERPRSAPPPTSVDWDLWCGGSPVCQWYPAVAGQHGALHPHDFHSWINYGNGSIGNMGTHLLGPASFSLRLYETQPETVRMSDLRLGCSGSWNVSARVDWTFPAHGKFAPVAVHWFEGVKPGVPYDQKHVDWIGICRSRDYQNVPAAIIEAERKYGQDLGKLGTLFIGEKGAAYMDFHCQRLRVLPEPVGVRVLGGRMPVTLAVPPDIAHTDDFFRAVRTGERAACDFDRSEPLAEMLLQANALSRTGEGTYQWKGARFAGDTKANEYLAQPSYREGWNPWLVA